MYNKLPALRWMAVLTSALIIPGIAVTAGGSDVHLSQLSASQGLVLKGGAASDELGYSARLAGDINADGFDDLVIAAPKADPNDDSSGMAYVVFGASGGLSGSIDLTVPGEFDGFQIQGAAAFDYAGFSVGPMGDVNGDGFDDFVVSAPSSSIDAQCIRIDDQYCGAVYVVYGDSAFESTLDLSVEGNYSVISSGEDYADFGWSVSGSGDFNDDGKPDLVIGAPGANGFSGAAYVIFGSGALPATIDELIGSNGFSMAALGDGDSLGEAVAGGSDINGDGIDDVIIGAPLAGAVDAFNGAVYVVFGSADWSEASLDLSTLNGSNGFVVKGETNGDAFGSSVAFSGDVNGDGLDDMIIGAPTSEAEAPFTDTGVIFSNGFENGNSGTSYIIFGRAQDQPFDAEYLVTDLVDGQNGFALMGEHHGDESGSSVGGRVDLNSDGIEDLLIGAPSADPAGSDSGASYVVFGKAEGESWAASMNLDALNGSNGYRILGASAGDESGRSVGVAGDIDQDGRSDLIIGSPMADATGSNSGESYVIYSN